MKIITQLDLFEEENLGDLEKLSRVFQVLPDEPLIHALNQDRGKGRNDFPNHAMWRAFLAKFVFQHPTIESFCRELGRNSQLRQLCGFQAHGVKIGQNQTKLVLAPHAMTFSRFLKRLSRHRDLIYDMFEILVKELYEALPDFGRRLAMDGKIIESKAHRPSKLAKGDWRGEHDGSWTKKTYHDKENRVTKTRTYFGFRVHLICDSVYELPIAFRVLPAHVSEKPTAREMVEDEQVVDWERAKVITLDSGYEDSKLQGMIENRDVAFLADGRHLWQEPEVRQYRNTSLFYNEEGEVFYKTEEQDFIQLEYRGYDKSRKSQRFGFPKSRKDRRIFRIACSENPRIFPRISRQSKKFRREYRRRTAAERINGRLDRDFRFEDRSIRGLAKMDLFVSMAFLIQLAFACAKVREQETAHLAAWVV